MIFEDLAKTTNDMQELQKKISIQKNKAAQDQTDNKFRILLTQTTQFISSIEYIYTNTGVEQKEEVITGASGVLNTLEESLSSGLADNDTVVKAEDLFKNLQADMKKNWSKQFADLTGSTVSTLEAIRGINTEQVSECLGKIQTAVSWDINPKQFMDMQEGLDDANQLIISLGLDDEIKAFLKNTTDGKATLKDLNDRVLSWIREENLEGKIRISFVKSIKK